MASSEKGWSLVAAEKRFAILQSLPAEWKVVLEDRSSLKDVTGPYIEKFLDVEEILITNSDAVTILENVANATWTARQVTKAFCHRAALAHQMTNCLHEMCWESAMAEAERLDNYFERHKTTVGPLHGLPISMKDQFHIKGTESTLGYVGWIGTFEGKRQTETSQSFESFIVQILRSYGAIFFCKTSVTQALMSGETANNIIGYTFNPKNRNLSAGGSSGGEGALMALRGSPVGFGSDIGGSIRVPAAFNGLYGIRPSVGRLPYRGVPISMDGQESIPCVIGPMATTIRSLKLMFQTVLRSEPWSGDPMVLELPWRQQHEHQTWAACHSQSSASNLTIGIFRHDGVVGVDPPVQRALDMMESALRREGHNYETWMFDGGQDIHHNLGISGEPIVPQLEMAFGSTPGTQKNASEIAAINVKLREYRTRYFDYWNSTSNLSPSGRPADAFISAIAPFAAPLPQQYTHNAYSTTINVLDYTATVLPVTTVDQEIDVIDTQYQPLTKKDRLRHENYDPELYHGAHVGLQIVTQRLQEEKAVVLTEYLDSLLKGDYSTAMGDQAA
ncbi:uncharacterized protein HMPREF1541_10450 [Cyphellophora europaea CBS 101466]|uniref:amidase n=1 Tax=Cyphellophora europaea (strain CBS 101466) TaxID=1220924 RepID=W2S6L2_CYPE1|nr:uncharacterized protein HMPREF1541_10450 [Cyphellophora europaea CBS 101466]ETN44270.1 hypothetical protein HMPREF1541_10450 [Cyphellophora europaea CBS 101466]